MGKNKPGPFLPFYIFKLLNNPITPNKIKIIFDIISIVFEESFVPSNLPKKIAIVLLATIPQIEPQISEILYKGYCIPNPIDDKNVLSPISPIAMLEATINIQFFVNEPMNFIM